MSDFLIDESGISPYIAPREEDVAKLEEEMRDVKTVLSRLEPLIVRIDAALTSTLQHLATRSQVGADISSLRIDMTQKLFELPTKTYMWGVLAVLVTAYTAGLAGLAVIK
jgi:hypothetical protein